MFQSMSRAKTIRKLKEIERVFSHKIKVWGYFITLHCSGFFCTISRVQGKFVKFYTFWNIWGPQHPQKGYESQLYFHPNLGLSWTRFFCFRLFKFVCFDSSVQFAIITLICLYSILFLKKNMLKEFFLFFLLQWERGRIKSGWGFYPI